MTQPYVFARSCAEPDREFHSLRALAEAICRARAALPGWHDLVLTPANVARGDGLPGGAAVSIRAIEPGDEGKGDLLGYALIPHAYGQEACRLLLAAILTVEPAAAA